MFIALLSLLIVFLIAFIVFFTYLRTMTSETYTKYCFKKVGRISKRKNLLSILDLHLLNNEREKLKVNHVIFGRKYIYLISDLMLKGFVSGEVNDNSWVYFNNITKKSHYLDNLNKVSDKNIQDFAGILGISCDPIISICLIPNECDISVNGYKDSNKMIVHYASLSKTISSLEREQIGSFKQEQIYEQYEKIKSRNEEK